MEMNEGIVEFKAGNRKSFISVTRDEEVCELKRMKNNFMNIGMCVLIGMSNGMCIPNSMSNGMYMPNNSIIGKRMALVQGTKR